MAAPVTTLAPAVAALALMLLTLASGLDFRLADQLYAWQGGAWSLRHDFLVSKILHAKAQKLSIAIELSMVGLALASHWHPRLRRWRRGLSCVAVTGLAGLALVSLGKHALPMACPSQLERYGGLLPSRLWLGREFVAVGKGCFPSAHASGGFALCGWYFHARYYGLPGAWRYAAAALAAGAVLGLAQQIRGAHFLSHDFAAVAVCWTTAWLLARGLLRPPAPVR
ncbi:MAG: phosphatase PAP2 family protein [Gammaproteobacteria bacterium]|nr:phosphatase PAP2 family protein [Gammaproteobacteria bacterium]